MLDRRRTFDEPAVVAVAALRFTLSGAFALDAHGARDRPMRLTLALRPVSLVHLVGGDLEVDGAIEIDGFAAGATRGRVHLGPCRRVQIELEAHGDDPVRLVAEGSLSLAGFPPGFTELRARIEDGQGTHLGRARLRFDVRSYLWAILGGARAT